MMLPANPLVNSNAKTTTVDFAYFVELLHRISKIQPHQAGHHGTSGDPPPVIIFRQWSSSLQHPLPTGTSSIIFRLLFPEMDTNRTYEVQEMRLANALIKIFGVSVDVSGSAGDRLRKWSEPQVGIGCLGSEVEAVMQARTSRERGGDMTLEEVDALLDELASLSSYSHVATSSKPRRTRLEILGDLYRRLSPREAGFMTQIILKDLRPLLYPPPSQHTTINLIKYNSAALYQLTKWDAMKEWHPAMPQIYRIRADLDHACRAVDALRYGLVAKQDMELNTPRLGTPVEIPKCLQGRSCVLALRALEGASDVWAETKYDGERMQIHIDLSQPTNRQIKIFSKKKRDSTEDRIATHPIIRASLSLPPHGYEIPLLTQRVSAMGESPFEKSVPFSAILEAEMVAFTEEDDCIDEFWRIRKIIESTAETGRGSRRRPPSPIRRSQDTQSQNSTDSNDTDDGSRHLMVVFFDILLLDGNSLLWESYETRRTKLEDVITTIPGFSMLAERTPINMRRGLESGSRTLRNCFARSIADCKEGLVLKASEAAYNVKELPWVKLKKDYIPGLGDCVDLVVIGAGWDKNRARELQVSPDTLTTFYLACITNTNQRRNWPDIKPHFACIFTVAYGLDREQLYDLYLKTKNAGRPYHPKRMEKFPYTVDFANGLTPPQVLFPRPMLFEIFGAGFTKASGGQYYEIRFPRISKVYRDGDRDWTHGVILEDFQRMAHESVGRDPIVKRINDKVDRIWGEQPSPGVTSPQRRLELEIEWVAKLQKEDDAQLGKKRRSRLEVHQTPPSVHPTRRARQSMDSMQAANVLTTTTNIAVKPPRLVATKRRPDRNAETPPRHRNSERSRSRSPMRAPSALQDFQMSLAHSPPPANSTHPVVSAPDIVWKSSPTVVADSDMADASGRPSVLMIEDDIAPHSTQHQVKPSNPGPTVQPPAGTALIFVMSNQWSAKCEANSCRLDSGHRVFSFEAFLVGVDWKERLSPNHLRLGVGQVERGLIFVDDPQAPTLVDYLDRLRSAMGTPPKTPIHVYSSEQIHASCGSALSNYNDSSVRPIWTSQMLLPSPIA